MQGRRVQHQTIVVLKRIAVAFRHVLQVLLQGLARLQDLLGHQLTLEKCIGRHPIELPGEHYQSLLRRPHLSKGAHCLDYHSRIAPIKSLSLSKFYSRSFFSISEPITAVIPPKKTS